VVDSPQEICEEFTEEIVMKKSDWWFSAKFFFKLY